jgi:hypothetical protein
VEVLEFVQGGEARMFSRWEDDVGAAPRSFSASKLVTSLTVVKTVDACARRARWRSAGRC